MQELTARELQQYLQTADEPVCLLDVREIWEFETAHLPQSVLIPVAQIPHRMAELDASITTVVICHHGVRSRAVASFLEQHGFGRIINLSGGIDAWAKDVDSRLPIYS